MKVLVSAYACEPGKGSEPEVGWQWVRQIARFHETWVITRANNRSLIEAGLKSEPNRKLHFVYVDLPDWAKVWKKGRRGVHLYYYLWQLLTYRQSKKLEKKYRFDIAHHITFINMYMGPWIALLKVLFIWGPIGANPAIPKHFYPLLGPSGVADNRLRLMIKMIAPYIDPVIRIGQDRAKRILAISKDVKARLRPEIQNKCITISQNAIDESLLSQKTKKHQVPLKILSVGQLVSIKGYRLSLEAFKKHLSLYPDSHFEIIGDGPLRDELTRFTNDLRIADSVVFSGSKTRDNVLSIMAESGVFLFPSFEGAGMVVLEAMAKGLPVVCLDFGGPGEYVTKECGIKVPLTEPEAVIQGLADALSRLASDHELYERLSAGAIKCVRENYLWDHVGDRLNALYREVCEENMRQG